MLYINASTKSLNLYWLQTNVAHEYRNRMSERNISCHNSNESEVDSYTPKSFQFIHYTTNDIVDGFYSLYEHTIHNITCEQYHAILNHDFSIYTLNKLNRIAIKPDIKALVEKAVIARYGLKAKNLKRSNHNNMNMEPCLTDYSNNDVIYQANMYNANSFKHDNVVCKTYNVQPPHFSSDNTVSEEDNDLLKQAIINTVLYKGKKWYTQRMEHDKNCYYEWLNSEEGIRYVEFKVGCEMNGYYNDKLECELYTRKFNRKKDKIIQKSIALFTYVQNDISSIFSNLNPEKT